MNNFDVDCSYGEARKQSTVPLSGCQPRHTVNGPNKSTPTYVKGGLEDVHDLVANWPFSIALWGLDGADS